MHFSEAAVPAKIKKLKTWTDDFSDARNWLIRQLDAFHGDQYFAGIFDHKEKRSVFKEKGEENWTFCNSVCLAQMGDRRSDAILPLDLFQDLSPSCTMTAPNQVMDWSPSARF